MKLYSVGLQAEAFGQSQKVSDREISMLKKKIRYNRTRFSWAAYIFVLAFVGVYSVFNETGLLPMLCVLMLLTFPAAIDALKKKTIHSCYAVVTEKKIRYAKAQRFSPPYVSYENTENGEAIKQKQHVFYAVYYCTVEINGQEYADVCCYAKDFEKIGIGDKVIVSTICDVSEVVVFAIE